ncbi:MAG: DUF1801 domain-containing protein [Salinivirgaceae bacterium]|nr:DUF1801 domain-containing protein [Salinivirgaceae bacterium]
MESAKPNRKMQNVSYKSVDEMLGFLPDDELKMTIFLRKLILDCIPGCQEKLSYNVPYYKRHANICFIWPASVTWGNTKTYDGIRLGFTKGCLLSDELNFLDKGDRKQVYWKDFTDIKQIDADLIKTYIFEAVEIDSELAKNKKDKTVNLFNKL